MHGPSERLVRWFWSGILGELYSGASETRFVRDLEQVPAWVAEEDGASIPRTVQDAAFVESRLHSLRRRNAAAYKGIYALLLANGTRDWMKDQEFGKAQYASLSVDIHHIFPQKWCDDNTIDDERRESIVNKTGLAYDTNRSIGGAAPSVYLPRIETKAGIGSEKLGELLEGHLVDPAYIRGDDFDNFFRSRREQLCRMVEQALGKPVQRDLDDGVPEEMSDQFEASMIDEIPFEGEYEYL